MVGAGQDDGHRFEALRQNTQSGHPRQAVPSGVASECFRTTVIFANVLDPRRRRLLRNSVTHRGKIRMKNKIETIRRLKIVWETNRLKKSRNGNTNKYSIQRSFYG